jgi:glyoxylase-like metal-dependent hydrolase (beta-lactamase superfamily II)
MAEQRPLPAWAHATGNSRVLISQTGNAFIVDAGYKGLFATLDEMTSKDRVKSVEGVWITHYHDDHTDYAQTLADRFRCPVYFTARMREILERPSHFRLPCLTSNAITSGKPQPDGARMRWHEFQLTFFDFPGQTLYHGGLLVEKDGGEALFFVGDSFTPSGIDDYCLQNRDFLREGAGYLYCLRVLRSLPKNAWLINQHVQPTFQFSAVQLEMMETELKKRMAVLKELSPWPDLNYSIDESWAAVNPYGSTVRQGAKLLLQVRILNHSPKEETYRVSWNLPPGWRIVQSDKQVVIQPQKEAAARAVLIAGSPGLHVITTDVEFAGQRLREWTEALVRVEPE